MMTSPASLARSASEDDRANVLDRRDAAERLLQRAQYLAPHDRLLLEQIYRHGLSVADVARLLNDRPRTLQRRVKRLLTRLNDPLFRFVAGRLEMLPRDMQTTARLVVLEGKALRDTARSTGLTLHRVRQHLDAVRTLARHA
ncbi:helix-turn-helix domain-containing protein [Phycisphaerales bacterium AB-hyl4]|uniref:Helix-turn-helix domain-containing protein n=1 Tax=Natronomicrosphaera hydrolytica TaxID=3242702 RepID=A0ABV4UA05_9BACT